MEAVKSAWERIAAWYGANTPEGTFVLAPGASEEEIVYLENAIGFRLPDDLRASYALHNGSLPWKTLEHAYLLNFGEFLSLKSILYHHKQCLQWQEEDEWGLGSDYEAEAIQGPIKPIWWSPLRLRLMENSGNGVMADFDPAPGGQWGQIIEFDHEVGPRQVLSASFGQWLTSIAEELEKGEYVYCEAEEGYEQYGGHIEKL